MTIEELLQLISINKKQRKQVLARKNQRDNLKLKLIIFIKLHYLFAGEASLCKCINAFLDANAFCAFAIHFMYYVINLKTLSTELNFMHLNKLVSSGQAD